MKIFRLSKDEYASICLCLLVSMGSLTFSLNAILSNIIGNNIVVGTLLIYCAFFFFLIAALVVNKFALKYTVLPFIILFISVAVFSLWTNPITSVFIFKKGKTLLENAIFVFFVFSFSGLVIATYIKDFHILFKYLERFSYAVIIIAFVYYFFFEENKSSARYMTFSYNFLLQAVFITLLCIKEFRIKRFICVAMGFTLLFVAGSRGALVAYLVCTLFYIIIYSFNSQFKKIIVSILVLGLILLIYNYFEEIINFVNKHLLELDISSRTVIKLAEGDFDNDTGRSLIQKKILENLNLFGHGFFVDRLISGGSYSHNLLVEFLCCFGLLGGNFLFGLLCLLILRALITASDIERIILITFISTGFVKLMFSGSFLNQEPGFYTLIGLCLSLIKRTENADDIRRNLT